MYKVAGFIIILSLLFSCSKKEEECVCISSGTLKGTVMIYSGNCMPGIIKSACVHQPISTTIAITLPSKDYRPELLIDSVLSDAEGNYEISLPEGYYSLFLRDGNEFVCSVWKCPSECYCSYFKISVDSVTYIDSDIDHAVW